MLSRSWGRRRDRTSLGRVLAGFLVALVVMTTSAAARGALAAFTGPSTSVIVRATPGSEALAERVVAGMGGTVRTRLSIIDGFTASLPAAAIPALRSTAGVVSVTRDSRLRPQSATYDPSGDVNSMASTTQYIGAQDYWRAGYTGQGVDVALIDSGIAPVDGLSIPGKVVYGPDLSLESQAPNLTNLDTYGHGTFMGGLIAGRDDGVVGPYQDAPASQYLGVAPDARILSIKVATADGGTDVSQVIAAIDWVVQHAHDPGLNVRVLNLSYGTNSTQSYILDPLAYAAEVAWKNGIVVVASAGNTGYQRGAGAPGLADPGYDPFIIGVGASDSMGTSAQWDDNVSSFSASSAGCQWFTCKKPDFVAPGAHLQGLRVPNSYIDLNHQEGLLGTRYFRGSGTSQAAAVASGAVALVLQKYPSLTPDQVNQFLAGWAVKLNGFDSDAQGAGELRLTPTLTKQPPNYVAKFTPATGTGSLEAARGSDHLTRNGVVLQGEQDIFGHPIDAAALALLEGAGSSWSGGNWNGSSWSGSSWSGSSWSSSSWSGSSWSGSSWSGSSWSGSSWSGNSWSNSIWG